VVDPVNYVPVGTVVNSYPSMPGQGYGSGAAQAWIFSTPENPKNAYIPLVPLFRLSYACNHSQYSNASAQSAFDANPYHTDTTYSTSTTGVEMFISWGYRLDGIEGYVYPPSQAQPAGTVRLMRKYNANRDDHAIFPETELSNMAAQGYTLNSGSDWIGYVYPNSGSQPSVQ
jgi:serine protease